ncbi:MAG TPA: type 1 glutamine amidotransferase domain-containing protein [Acidimicrobiia bacterium]|nr:type 1 glutamine amidotransferase domain-containing protein [Acidimicrobiia bacterium]
MDELSGAQVAFLVANEGVEQIELTEPWKAVEAAGGLPRLIAPKAGSVQAFHHLDRGDTFQVDLAVGAASAGDYIGLVLPGGVANPDQLRTIPDAVAFAKAFVEAGKPVAVICHGPWTLVEAGVVRNRTLTSWPSLKTDIENAGGHWVDREVEVCKGDENVIVSSRKPDDLPAFCAQLVQTFAQSLETTS